VYDPGDDLEDPAMCNLTMVWREVSDMPPEQRLALATRLL
jgi:hypothetical protein